MNSTIRRVNRPGVPMHHSQAGSTTPATTRSPTRESEPVSAAKGGQ